MNCSARHKSAPKRHHLARRAQHHLARRARANLMRLLIGAGCVLLAGVAQAEVVLSVGSGAYWHHQPAFEGVAAQFLGDRAPSEPALGGGGGIGPTLDNDGTEVRARAHYAAALTWRQHHRITPRLHWVTGVRLEWGQTRYLLPDGIDVLTDPITIRLTHMAASPTAALRWDVGQWGPVGFAVEGGVGVDVVAARTVLTSDLLDVRRTEWMTDAHGFTTLELSHDRWQDSALALGVQWRDSIGPAVRLDLQYRF